MRLLTGVRGPVIGQRPAPAKAAATVRAVVGLLACVDSYVCVETRPLLEALPARITRKGFLPGVNPLMDNKK